MSKNRRVAVLTTGRQDWGLLRPLCKQIKQHEEMELMLVAGGMALSERYGNVVSQIRMQGFSLSECLAWDVDASPPQIQASAALSKVGCFLESAEPEAIVLLGDRFETAAAALAATIVRVPIVHIFGGEETEGAFDNVLRHAITKLSHIHFVSHERYARRVIQMGEAPETVHLVGSLAVDNISQLAVQKDEDIERILGVDLTRPVVLVTVHPTTLSNKGEDEVDAVIEAIEQFEATYIVTLPNADPGNERIRDSFVKLAERNKRIHCFSALGEERYLRLMKRCDLVLGNSSSGMTEAPMLRRPTVNVGDRQKGRLRFPSIIDTEASAVSILAAVQRATSEELIRACHEMEPPFGKAGTARRMVECLSRWRPPRIVRKSFVDAPGNSGSIR